MTFEGIVQGGVIVLKPGVLIPEGTLVRIEPIATPEPNQARRGFDVFRMGDLAVDTGVSDLATNIDHYLYGHPKITDAK